MSFSSKSKSFQFQAMAPSKMSAPMVEKYTHRPIVKSFSMMKNYLLNHTLRLNK